VTRVIGVEPSPVIRARPPGREAPTAGRLGPAAEAALAAEEFVVTAMSQTRHATDSSPAQRTGVGQR
jgi:hypothetical protein